MKLRPFGYMSDASFKTLSNGQRVFLPNSNLLARPYVVPDQETEGRLYRLQVWVYRIFYPLMVVGYAVLLSVGEPPYLIRWEGMLAFIVLGLSLLEYGSSFVFKHELSRLVRNQHRVTIREFNEEIAQTTSYTQIICSLLGCLVLVLIFWEAFGWEIKGAPPVMPVASFALAFFGVVTGIWIHIFTIKWRSKILRDKHTSTVGKDQP